MNKEEREEAISYIKLYRRLDENLHNTAPKDSISYYATDKCLKYWDMAIQALSQEPTEKPMTVDEMEREYEKSKALFHKIVECDDAISREAVLKLKHHKPEYGDMIYAFDVEQLPSVTQKSGKWILTIEDWNKWTCSNCGYVKRTDIHVNIGWKFCPNCGAKMEVEE